MDERDLNVRKLAEENFVEAPANLGDCVCDDERKLRMALSELRFRPEIFSTDHIGIKGAYCATHDRCKH
ncbi:hypothetical protein [Desulfomonile tiedjei]|uniref:Uncharacterized protein n=1 Tax=Desulfomonile tiedjei (strain ATCC 49306 / DSM 6799 / DCB-1) TaxID=706587 RepID=I4CAG6_DESTA|nr:hypothetical protein [Desulfomonile tiedjei]AFM26557.1 hypothetical protein Desti_3915 [Desulfomonile tiedjei DSM 6799]